MGEDAKEIGRALAARRDALAEAVTALHFELRPELESRYGAAGREKCLQDARYHLSYLAEAVGASSPALFTDYVGWAKAMLTARGIPASDLARNLEVTREVLRRHLPADAAAAVDEYLDAGLKVFPQPHAEPPTFLDEPAPHAELARQYLTLLLRGERHLASRLILGAVEAGTSVRDLYLHVFQPSQREVGRLWQLNQINVAQEHYCTASTQLIMSQLYPRIFRTERRGLRMVALSVAGELHEIGLRMVADFFEMGGWDTYYVGANTPAQGLLQVAAERKPHVLAVSATMTYHLRAVEELIAAARAAEPLREVKIMVGGYPFDRESDLWQRVGADLYAADAERAVEAAERLCAGPQL